MNNFAYNRRDVILKLDEQNNPIPILDENQVAIPNQFEKTEIVRRDVMNLDFFIRAYRKTDDHLIILLNDGHEATEKVPVLINPKKGPVEGNIKEEKNRVWLQSEIILTGDDIERFYSALGI